MKTYFRVDFQMRGWVIQYKNGIYGTWVNTINPESNGTTCFSDIDEAEKVRDGLKNGHSYPEWFVSKEEVKTFAAHENDGQTA